MDNKLDDQEPIGDVSGEIAFDKVINLNDVKLFRRKAVVAYLEGAVYDFGPASVSFDNPVPVFDDDDKKLGFAVLKKEGNRLIADIGIDYQCEERLLIENGDVKFYPRLFGKLGVPAFPLFDFQAPLPVVKLVIEGIELSRSKPTDSRLDALAASVT